VTLPVLPPLHGEIIAPGDGVTIVLRASPLREERHVMVVPAGLSLQEMVTGFVAPLGYRPDWLALRLGGDVIARELWPRIRVKPGGNVSIVAMPQGKWLRQALLAVVAVVALVAAPYLAAPLIGALGLAAGGAAAAFVTAGIGLAITLAGTLAVNALFPVAKADSSILGRSPAASIDPVTGVSGTGANNTERSPTYSIGGGRNEARPYGTLPSLLGTHRMSPALGAKTYTETVGDDQYLRMLFVWGYGPIVVSDLKIGETPVSSFEGFEIETWENHSSETLRLFPNAVFEEPLSLDMTGQTSWVQRTTADDIDEISVDVVFQGGLYRFEKATGNRAPYSVTLSVQHRLVGSGSWISSGFIEVTSDSVSALRRTLRIVVARGQYDVRMSNANAAYSGEDTVQEGVNWSALRGIRKELPIKSPVPLTISVMRIKASSQLSGVIETFNGVVRMRVKAWNGATWIDGVTSNNPADLFRHVLQSSANARPVTDAEIDLPSLQGWHAYCVAQGFTFNQVRDFTASVFETLRDIAQAGRAAVSLRDGRWGVIWDEGSAAPVVQHFTPRNSSNFEGVRAFVDMPHGFRVRFINAKNNWLQDERVVYDDGFTVANATKFEGLDFPGVTDPDLIWRHGRYHLAQLRLRRETYTLTTDFEHMVCRRGDRVRVQHDVPQWGLGAARIRAVDAGSRLVTLDEPVVIQSGRRYTLRVRLADGAALSAEVTAAPGETRSLTLLGDGPLPEAGNLAMFGELNRESVILRVLSIEPRSDLTAKVYLVDDAPGISAADQGLIPPFDTGSPPPVDLFQLPPLDLRAVEGFDTSGQVVRSRLVFSWQPPASGIVSAYVVERRAPASSEWTGRQIVPGSTTEATMLDLAPGVYTLRVRAVFAAGQVSRWAELGAVNVGLLAAAPAPVEGFAISSVADVATLSWQAILSPAVSHYRIKYSPALTGVTWSTASVLFDRLSGQSVQTTSRPGSYLIKAVTWYGAESDEPAIVVTTVAPLSALNVVELVNEAPDFGGSKAGVELDVDGKLRLVAQEDWFAAADVFAPADWFFGLAGLPVSGIYTFFGSVDLTDVYTVRITAQIDAIGERITADFFAAPDFFAASDFFGVDASQWDVTVEVRATSDDPSGSPVWSAWAPLVIGDVTARAFQFRAVLNSYDPAVTPLVSGLAVTVDMPDRVLAGNDIAVPAAGLAIPFTPPFRALQGVAVSAEGLATGDRYEITAKSQAGFTIRFFNSAGAGVARTFDYVAKGYGAVE
jgi:hypothetical protein